MEIKVALEEWLKRVPEFELTDSNKVTWAGGPVRGPRSIPLTWEASQENPVKGNSAPAESN